MPGQLENIRIFLTVLDANSFAAASRKLGLSRPAVTRAVAELEAALETQLLVRTTRRVAATFAGETYADQVRRVVAEVDRADAALRALSGGAGGTLRLSAPLSFGMRYLPEIAEQFRVRWPETALILDLTDGFVDIFGGSCDMALRISGPPSEKSSIWRKIAEVSVMLVASPDFIAQHDIQAPEDLQNCPCLVYSNHAGGDIWALRDPETGSVRPIAVQSQMICNNGETLAVLAGRGQGVALMPRFIAREELDAGRLVHVLPGWQPPEIWLTAIYPPYDRLPLPAARLTAIVEDQDWSCLK